MRSIRLIGLPTDVNSSFLRGPARAPAHIREALFSDMGNLATERGLSGPDRKTRAGGAMSGSSAASVLSRIDGASARAAGESRAFSV